MTETRPDHDAELNICDQVYYFRREHDLLRRLEQRLGALLSIGERLRRFAVTQRELAMIYEEILKGDKERPSASDIERWIWEEGTPKLCAEVAPVVFNLAMGNRTLRLYDEEQRIARTEQLDKAAAARPTEPESGPARTQILGDLLTAALKRG